MPCPLLCSWRHCIYCPSHVCPLNMLLELSTDAIHLARILIMRGEIAESRQILHRVYPAASPSHLAARINLISRSVALETDVLSRTLSNRMRGLMRIGSNRRALGRSSRIQTPAPCAITSDAEHYNQSSAPVCKRPSNYADSTRSCTIRHPSLRHLASEMLPLSDWSLHLSTFSLLLSLSRCALPLRLILGVEVS